MLAGVPPMTWQLAVERVKRSVFEAMPMDSSKLKPAPGTCKQSVLFGRIIVR